MQPKELFRGRTREIAWSVFFLAAAAVIAWQPGAGSDPNRETTPPTPSPTVRPLPTPPLSIWDRMVYPTDQPGLLEPLLPGVYQPTASGKLESALYGSVRTVRRGRRLLPSFHKGIDIAALQRDRKNRPLDPIYAVAEGTIAYINRIAGNSSYGIYLVLVHADPAGPVYSLYSHLASIAPDLREGQRVTPGEILGVMGTTATYRIPLSRAHLHFELGLIGNDRFARWARSRKIRNDHGKYNGWNLMPVDPLEFFCFREENPGKDFLAYLRSIPVAFRAVIGVERFPDFFRRYPEFWEGEPVERGAIVISCCQYGIPLKGRAADREETDRLGNERILVEEVNLAALGRNGRRLITRRGSRWTLGSNGRNWLSLLTY